MAVEKQNVDPNLADDEQLDLGDEVEGVDSEVLEQAAEEGEDEGEGLVEQQSAATADDPAPKPGKAPQTIPYDRFAEVNERRKAAEEAAQAEREARIRLEEQLKAAQARPAATEAPPPPAVDTRALIKERNAALLEGDDDLVAEIEEKLEAERRRQAVALIREEQEQANAKAQETELQRAAAEIVAAYPFLDSASADADADAIEDVMALRDRGIAKGMPPADALRKAVERFKPAFDARVGAVDDGAGAPDPSAASKVRNARAANQQPPAMRGGMSAGAVPALPDVNKMSVDEWAKLPDSEREKLLV